MPSNQISLLAIQAFQSTSISRAMYSTCDFSHNPTWRMFLERFQMSLTTLVLSDDNQFPCDLNPLPFQESGLFSLKNKLWKLNTSASKHESNLGGESGVSAVWILLLYYGSHLERAREKKGSVLNSLFVRRCACSPWGEATLLFHQIKWSEAVPFQEEPIKLFKEVYYCDGLWNHSHRIHWGVCFDRGVNVCTLPLRKLIKAVDSSFPFAG